MKREFLQDLKVGDQSLPKEVIDAIMAENGRDIEAAVAAHKQELADRDAELWTLCQSHHPRCQFSPVVREGAGGAPAGQRGGHRVRWEALHHVRGYPATAEP